MRAVYQNKMNKLQVRRAIKKKCHKKWKQAEAEVVPSSSLVKIRLR